MGQNAMATFRPLLALWDVDHTLIENSGISKDTYARAFERLTGRSVDHEIHTEGRTDPEIMLNMLTAHGIEPTTEHVARIPEALESSMSANASRLRERGYALPGAHTTLEALRDAPGVIQAPLTGNIRPNAFTKLSVFGLHAYLDFEVGAYGSDDHVRANLVGIARRRAATKYNATFDTRSTILLGDTWRDVRAGRDGGAFVVAVASGSDSIDRLQAEGADIVLPDLRDAQSVVEAVTSVRHRPELGGCPIDSIAAIR